MDARTPALPGERAHRDVAPPKPQNQCKINMAGTSGHSRHATRISLPMPFPQSFQVWHWAAPHGLSAAPTGRMSRGSSPQPGPRASVPPCQLQEMFNYHFRALVSARCTLSSPLPGVGVRVVAHSQVPRQVDGPSCTGAQVLERQLGGGRHALPVRAACLDSISL